MTYRPLPVRPQSRVCAGTRALWRRAIVALAASAVFALAAAVASAEPGEITDKREEARAVLGQIQELDASLEHAVEDYNAANVRLEGIETDQELNRRTLRVARRNLARTQMALGRHLLSIYTSGDALSGIGVILGATSFSDVIDRVDALAAVKRLDTQVLAQVERFKRTIEAQKRRLADARARQEDLVAARAHAKADIEGQLTERRRLVASIRSEIGRLEAEERARQERLAREARERLARLQAAERAARQRAREEAAQRTAATTSTAATTREPEHVHVHTASGADENSSELGIVAETPDAAVVPPSGRGGDVVSIAMQYLGVPYVWGGASPGGFDCSGLTLYVYAQIGISLPHYTGDQWNMGVPVSRDQLQPGDLVFFNGLGHEGMYIGGGQFIHAPHTGDVVKISNLTDSWYAATWEGARRIL